MYCHYYYVYVGNGGCRTGARWEFFVVYVLRQVEMVRGRRQGNYWKRVCRNCFTPLLITSVWAIMPTLVMLLPPSYLVRSRLAVWMISRALGSLMMPFGSFVSLVLTFSGMKRVSEMIPCWIRCWTGYVMVVRLVYFVLVFFEFNSTNVAIF